MINDLHVFALKIRKCRKITFFFVKNHEKYENYKKIHLFCLKMHKNTKKYKKNRKYNKKKTFL